MGGQASSRGCSGAKAVDGSGGRAARHRDRHGGGTKHERHRSVVSQTNLSQKRCKRRAQLHAERRRAPQGEPERSGTGALPKHNPFPCTKRLVSEGLADPVQLPNAAPVPRWVDVPLMYFSVPVTRAGATCTWGRVPATATLQPGVPAGRMPVVKQPSSKFKSSN